jgi:hypothetical protein
MRALKTGKAIMEAVGRRIFRTGVTPALAKFSKPPRTPRFAGYGTRETFPEVG